MTELELQDPQGRRDTVGWIWYPTDSEAAPGPVLGNAVWASVEAIKDAEPASDKRPLVLVSHGMYGNIFNQAWLGRELAERGYTVAAVNHPGSTSFDRRPEESRRLWERPADLSRLLDKLLADPTWADRIDVDRIAAVGHSLGGLTVMRLAGAGSDFQAHRDYCATDAAGISCGALSQLNIGHPEDYAQLAASNRDQRISAVVSLDLGGTQTLTAESLAAIDIPVLVVGAPRGEQIDQQKESLALAAMLPPAQLEQLHVPNTGHFDFLGLCTDQALDILREEEPDDVMVCLDGQQPRAQRHAQFIEAIDQFLTRRLPPAVD
jgi:predicted dienelactone hydrolase